MKRFFLTVAVLATITGLLEARGPNKSGGSSSGGSSGNGTSSSSSSGNKVGTLNKTIGNGSSNGSSNGQSNSQGSGQSPKKLTLQGNTHVANLAGFKSDPMKHTQLLQKYNVPKSLHNFCFFNHDFCYNHCCWFPSFGCCGYWHPHCQCWYYWYEPYCCYLPYSYIETYRPVVVTETTPVTVNVNTVNQNGQGNVNTDVTPSLPPGASAALPAGVNPMIPAKQ